MQRILAVSLFIFFIGTLAGCAAKAHRPCSEGGEPSREKTIRGTKQCLQVRDRNGKFVNDGDFVEWHPNGQRAGEGEYKMGAKHGKWTEWDERGKKISEKYFENGSPVNPPR
ncbi:MAG: hypothetical protein A2Z97_16215 [Bdellovibrionales bacterium GWB1_52_6]|nr:MAG: hypothetical protein A2Z97_16215 [Bdellovibrionales bacterium GWB1_52_6]